MARCIPASRGIYVPLEIRYNFAYRQNHGFIISNGTISYGMIIGSGDIASVLPNKKGWIFFASGVSNSSEKRESEYQREIDLLMKQDKKKHLVYFSSLSVFYRNTRYTRHKKQMEELVKSKFKNYTIVRLGNITWGKNPHTLINHFRNLVKEGEKLDIWDTHRYLVDKKEFLHWINMIPNWNCELNIVGRWMKVSEIVKEIKAGKL